MNILEVIDTNPNWASYTKAELTQLLSEAKAELEIQSSANTNNKIKINAGYGILSQKFCRWKKHVNAEAITSCGQLCVRGVGHYIRQKTKDNDFRIDIQYFDTDSLFCNYPNKEKILNEITSVDELRSTIIDWNKEHVQPLINEYFDKLAIMFNAVENKIEMDFELIADKSMFLAAKKYTMRKLFDDGKYIDPKDNIFKVRGVEIVRTTTPVFFRKKLEEAIIYLFNKTNDELVDFVKEVKTEYFKLGFEEMSNPSGVNNMDKYKLGQKRIPLHVYGSLVYNEFILRNDLTDRYQLITDKAKIKFTYIKQPNRLNSHVVAVPNNIVPEELIKVIQLDYEHQFEKNFMKPIMRFMDVIGWKKNKTYSWDECFE